MALIHKETIRTIRGLREYYSLNANLQSSLVNLSIYTEELWSSFLYGDKITSLTKEEIEMLRNINVNYKVIVQEHDKYRFDISLEGLQDKLSEVIDKVIEENQKIESRGEKA